MPDDRDCPTMAQAGRSLAGCAGLSTSHAQQPTKDDNAPATNLYKKFPTLHSLYFFV